MGYNVDKQKKARDVRSDHKGQMYHVYSILALKSRVPMLQLPHIGSLEDTPAEQFLPGSVSNENTDLHTSLLFYSRLSHVLLLYTICSNGTDQVGHIHLNVTLMFDFVEVTSSSLAQRSDP